VIDLVTGPRFAAFLAASLILAITPGPAVVFIVTQTLGCGRRAGMASVGGIALGNLGNAAAASLGLAALFAVSMAAFNAVKLAGAAYLIFLGIRALRARPAGREPQAATARRPSRLFREGFWVALLNPKTALFFAALLPQFMNPAASPLRQSLTLGALFVAIALGTDTIYVYSSAALAALFRRRSAWSYLGRYLSAASFIGLGLYAAIAVPRMAK
jgi:threonine/homoserine/homoserine lactone efflux protein